MNGQTHLGNIVNILLKALDRFPEEAQKKKKHTQNINLDEGSRFKLTLHPRSSPSVSISDHCMFNILAGYVM